MIKWEYRNKFLLSSRFHMRNGALGARFFSGFLSSQTNSSGSDAREDDLPLSENSKVNILQI